MKLIDLTGKKFGRLAVVTRRGYVGREITWLCKCDCGKEVVVLGNHLRRGAIISCGCYHKEEVSRRVSGKGNPMYGLPREKNPMMRADVREKVSNALRGEGNPMFGRTMELNPAWRGGISFEPYCPKFDDAFREHIRDKFGRKCYTCPITEHENGRRLCVHHIDYNHNSICNGKEWAFVPMCGKCHAKSGANRWYWFNLLINYWCEEWLDGCYLV